MLIEDKKRKRKTKQMKQNKLEENHQISEM